MNFVLVGCDDDSLRICRALLGSPRNRLVAVASATHCHNKVSALAPTAKFYDEWESILNLPNIDWTIVAPQPNRDVHHDALRKLVQAECPVAAIFPECDALVAYELEMIRVDSRSPVVPLFVDLFHPGIRRLRQLVNPDRASLIVPGSESTTELTSGPSQNDFGRCEQLQVERHVVSRTKEQNQSLLACDIAIARQVVGELRSVSATGGRGDSTESGPMSVVLSGPSDVLVHWSVGLHNSFPLGAAGISGSTPRSRYTLSFTRGRVWLDFDHESAAVLNAPGHQERLELNDDELRSAVEHCLGVASQTAFNPSAKESAKESKEKSFPPPSHILYSWESACRDLDLAETAELSMRRGRTIELMHDMPTEQASFKAVMAMGGCAILLIIFLVVLVWGMVAGIELAQHRADLPVVETKHATGAEARDDASVESVPRWPLVLRLWPVYPLAAFLILQVLVIYAKGRRSGSGDG